MPMTYNTRLEMMLLVAVIGLVTSPRQASMNCKKAADGKPI